MGGWRDQPGTGGPTYRCCEAFRRLRTLLSQLVPLPGKPFKRSRCAFVPLFEIRGGPKLFARPRMGGTFSNLGPVPGVDS